MKGDRRRDFALRVAALGAILGGLLASPAGAAERVAVFGEALVRPGHLVTALQRQGLEPTAIGSADLTRLDELDAALAVLGPDAACPPESRPAIDRFLRSRRPIIVIGAHAFDYQPRVNSGLSAVDLANDALYRILQPKLPKDLSRSRDEPVQVTKTSLPDGRSALEFRTRKRGMNDVVVEFDVATKPPEETDVLAFWAKGDAYADLLTVQAWDDAGAPWLALAPIGSDWQRLAVPAADFLPLGWSDPEAVPPRLDLARVRRVAIGIDGATVWREKPMAFSLGGIEWCKAEQPGAPTSRLTGLRWPFRTRKTEVPAWLFDPFRGAAKVAPPPGFDEAWRCPAPLLLHPGVQMGTDHRAEHDAKPEREQRREVLWPNAAGDAVAELRYPTGGRYAGSALTLFGVGPAELGRSPERADQVARLAAALLRRPAITRVTINTTPERAGTTLRPRLELRIRNPRAVETRGRVAVEVEGLPRSAEVMLVLPARADADTTVDLGAVPETFRFDRFRWRVTWAGEDGGHDAWDDEVDVERALLHALAHLVRTQRAFPDGRISHHYFGDAYGVRAIFAYLDLLAREPERRQRHSDLWAATSESDLRAGGLRWADMLLARQNLDGSIPMGYGETSDTYNVADGGQIALAIGQIAARMDSARRAACVDFCRRFAAWAETFYLDADAARELSAAATTDSQRAQAKAGHYGLGSSRGVRNRYGPSWVLPDILGVQLLLTYLDPNPNHRRIADRNLLAYLDAGYAAAGYFHAEALLWAWRDAIDEDLRRRIAGTLERTFLPPLREGRAHEMFELGARGTLRALPLLYYRRHVDDTPDLRAAQLKYTWTFGAESSERSMRRLAEAYPKPQHGDSLAASKYASFSAIWAVELLAPGSTFLPAPEFPRPGGR